MRITTVHDEIAARSKRRRERLRDVSTARSPTPARNDLLPHLQIISWPIDKLHPPKRSIRKMVAAQVERTKESLKAFGFVQPILIRGHGEIVKGRTRVEAARQLGLMEVPCIAVDHLTETEVRALRVALGRLPECGEWDFAELKVEFAELVLLDAPLEAIGFTLPEIDALILEDDPNLDLDELPDMEQSAPPISKLGDVWRLGGQVIICGDACHADIYETLLGDEEVRLVLTDEPFNVKIAGHVTSGVHREFAMAAGEMSRAEFEAFNVAWMTPCLQRLMPGGLLATFMDWRSIELVLTAGRQLDLELLNLVVWDKTNAGMGSLWRSKHELLPFFKKPGAAHINNVELGRHGRWRSNVWTYPGASSLGSDARAGLADHPTVKPVALLEDALLDVTHPDDLVLEPFAGSGSTLIACETTGRCCRAIELDPGYVDVVVRRWQKLTGEAAIHRETGKTFDEMAGASDRGANTGTRDHG